MAHSSGPWGVTALRLVSPALVVVFVAGCGGERPGTATPAALRPATPTVASPTSAPTGRPARTLIPPAGQRGFLASLKAIDRALAADRERALDHAVDICYQLYDGKPRETIRTYAREAYSGSTHRISRATARKIVARAERWVCRDGTLHSRWES